MLMDAEFDPVVADIRRAERKTEEEAWNDCPRYSTDGNVILDLEKEMNKRGYMIAIFYEHGKYIAEFWMAGGRVAVNYANTIPLAIAFAAYKALTGKEWDEPQ